MALLLLAAFAVAARRVRGLAAAAAAGLGAVAAGIVLASLGPSIPDAWVTALQEGLTEKHVRQLYGQGVHAGPGFRELSSYIAAEGAGSPLRATVRMNLGLCLANVGLFALIASRILRPPAALAFTLVFAVNPLTLHAAFSELPSALCTTYVLAGVAGAAIATDERAGGGARWLAVAALIGLSLLAALVRVETLALSLPATATAIAAARLGSERIEQWWTRLGRFAATLLTRPLPLMVGALLVLWVIASSALPLGGDLLDPLGVAALGLPAALLTFLPLGPVVLFGFGVVHGLRRPVRFLLLPLGLVVLYKAYFSASHSATAPFELLRYMTMLTAPALVLALFGWREVASLGSRLGWSEQGRRLARNLTALSFLCWTPTTLALLLDLQGADSRPLGVDRLLVRRHQQVEVRWLLQLVDEHPDCTFVSRVAPGGGIATEQAHTAIPWDLVLFGRRLPQPVKAELGDESLARSALARSPTACVLYYRGLDCNLSVAGDVCDRDSAQATTIQERTLTTAQYYAHVEFSPGVRLGVYELRRRASELESARPAQ